MTKSQDLDGTPLAELAERVNSAVDRMLHELKEEINGLRFEISRISRLADLTEESERAKALADAQVELDNALQRQQRIRRGSGFMGLKAPVETVKALLDVRNARSELAEADIAFNAPEVRAERATRIATHNQFVSAERASFKQRHPLFVFEGTPR